MTGRPDDWKQLLSRYGLGTVLALVLTYFLLQNVSGALANTATRDQVQGVDIKLDAHIQRMEAMSGEREDQLETQTRLLRLMCSSIARTDTIRVECQR